MPVQVLMPKLGLTMTEGAVAEWFKTEGEAVEKGEPLFALETDKITLEIEAPRSGVLSQILVQAGTTVPTGDVVALISGVGEDAPEQVIRPASGKGEREPDAGRRKVKVTPVARRLAEEAGLDVSTVAGSGPGGRITGDDVKRALATLATAKVKGQVRATPMARRLAKEAGLDLRTVAGSGPGGRITSEDVERAKAKPAPSVEARCEVTAISGVRAVIASRMAESAHTTAPVTTTTQADATEFVRLREALRAEWQPSRGYGPSYNDLLVVILAKALGEFPYMNAHLLGEEIHQFADVNVGLAVDVEKGLVVPVIKGVQDMTLSDVARVSRDLVARARAGTLLPDDLSGGTFTLSNMGTLDVDVFTPIINLPECAILGAGRIAPRPAVIDGELCVRQTVILSLTFDHRAIDGAPAARFLERVKHLVEQPALALVR